MNIDWKSRLKNPIFWFATFALFFSSLDNSQPYTLVTWPLLINAIQEFFRDPVSIGFFLMAFVTGVVNNPISPGLNDYKSIEEKNK